MMKEAQRGRTRGLALCTDRNGRKAQVAGFAGLLAQVVAYPSQARGGMNPIPRFD
jgi:hypothetical protein